jgi:hypothetical protein
MIAAKTRGDHAYIIAPEHTTASMSGSAAAACAPASSPSHAQMPGHLVGQRPLQHCLVHGDSKSSVSEQLDPSAAALPSS